MDFMEFFIGSTLNFFSLLLQVELLIKYHTMVVHNEEDEMLGKAIKDRIHDDDLLMLLADLSSSLHYLSFLQDGSTR